MNTQGTYALVLRLKTPREISVGKFGSFQFPSGWYLYLGSALGPGGLRARLARHKRRTDKRYHWHIDYLRAVTGLVEVWIGVGQVRQECGWATAAAALPDAAIIAPRFGASDCRCPSHLFHYSQRPQLGAFEASLQAGLDQAPMDANTKIPVAETGVWM